MATSWGVSSSVPVVKAALACSSDSLPGSVRKCGEDPEHGQGRSYNDPSRIGGGTTVLQSAPMELVPKALVVGVFTPLGIPGSSTQSLATAEQLNRIWVEVAPTYGYTQLQMAPDGSQANFLGRSPDDGVTIQPPLLQVRDSVALTPQKSAQNAEAILKTVARHLGVAQFFNLGIKYIFNAEVPDNDARGFLLHRILGKTDADLADLQLGGPFWAGVKFVPSQPEERGTYALVIEPLVRDMRILFLDLDAQFPGPAELDSVADRAKDAETYLRQSVSRYLDSLLG
jgi:hypothetical protein